MTESNYRQRVLRWFCDSCDWTCDVPMPGFAGGWVADEHIHTVYDERGEHFCGPLWARMLPVEADPGASSEDIARLVKEAGY